MKRSVEKQVQGYQTQDGAGVHLVRVLGHDTVKDFDPILMLDSFDSEQPKDYSAGCPMHPHRGIETISYVASGSMIHKDSLGNSDQINDGEVQWMRAGSGILHEEQLPPVKRLLGVQLWLNVSAKDKMVAPSYHSIKQDAIKEIPIAHGYLRLLAGTYEQEAGYCNAYQPLHYYDIHLQAQASFTLSTPPEHRVIIFTLLGDCMIEGVHIKEKTAATLSAGDELELKSLGTDCQILYISSIPLHEPIVWGGPIVMNTQEELQQAFLDLDQGTFLQENISYDIEGGTTL